MEVRPVHPFLIANGCGFIAAYEPSGPLSAMEGHSIPANPLTPLWLRVSPDEGAGEYTGSAALCRVLQGSHLGCYQSETKPMRAGVCDDWEIARSATDPFHTSPGAHPPEAFRAMPCRTVANAVSDAPLHTADLASADDSIEPPAGGDGVLLPPPASRNAPRNSRGPLTNTFTTFDIDTEAAL